jgi:hypothetical protein
MNNLCLDFVCCENCGRSNVIRPTMFAMPVVDPRWSRKETDSSAVSCFECKHVYICWEYKMAPNSPEWLAAHSPIRDIFHVQLACEDPGCGSPLIVLAPRRGGTSEEEMRSELSSWVLHDLTCPKGHPISTNPFDADARIVVTSLF